MSDYGFATFDEKTGRNEMKINSKWPVFGPEYAKIAQQFKTIHLTDTVSKAVKTASLSIPALTDNWSGTGTQYDIWYGESIYTTYVDEEIYKYEHGFKFRPLGYYTIAGNLNKNIRVNLVQTNVAGGADYGGNFTVNQVLNKTGMAMPIRNEMREATAGFDMMWNSSLVVPMALDVGGIASENVIIPNSCLGIFSSYPNNTELHSDYNADYSPYRVEIDDTYVRVIRRTAWGDHIVRAGYQNGSLNIRQRTKAIEDYAGTTLDITVYLIPYSMEDIS